MTIRNRMLALSLAALSVVPFAVAQAPSTSGTTPQTSKPTAAPKPTNVPPATKPTVKSSVPASWKQVPIPKLKEFKPQEPVRVQLPNGMVIFLQEDHELPLIGGSARIRGGSRLEPAEKTGMVDVYGDVWRTGGTTARSGDDLDLYLEARAAKVETSSGADSTSIGFNCLKQDFDDVFKVWLELLRDPAFREDKIALAKRQMDTGISRRNDSADEIAGRESVKLAYGKDNPYARDPEYATVAAITREDLLNWHKRFVHPNNIILGIAGDFDAKQMEARLRREFADWQKGPDAPKPQIQFTPAKAALYLVNKDDVNQSNIEMVALGIEKSNPDYFSIVVLNEVLGGGFSSRLFSNLRTKKGLAYSVGGGIGSGWDHPGITSFSIGTKSESTTEAIKGLWEEVDNIVTNPPTQVELDRAKDSILNGFVFNFDSPAKVMRERMLYEYYGYPADFLQRYRTAIEKVTVADTARVAKKYMHRDQLAVLVVGNASEFDKTFASLGQPIPVDITIPPPPGAAGASSGTGTESKHDAAPAPESPKASNAEGKALIAKVAQFLGGEQKLATVKSLGLKGTATRISPQGELELPMEALYQLPDHAAITYQMQGQELRTVITPTAAFQAMGGASARDLPAPLRQDILKGLKRDVVNVAQHAADPKYIFATTGTEKIGETEAAVLSINADGSDVRWSVDPKSGQVLRTIATIVTQSGPAQRVTEYSGWKQFDGVTLPTRRTNTENGEAAGGDVIDQWTLNPKVDPKVFDKPTT